MANEIRQIDLRSLPVLRIFKLKNAELAISDCFLIEIRLEVP